MLYSILRVFTFTHPGEEEAEEEEAEEEEKYGSDDNEEAERRWGNMTKAEVEERKCRARHVYL